LRIRRDEKKKKKKKKKKRNSAIPKADSIFKKVFFTALFLFIMIL
jgi:hypothetical protein